MSEIVIRELRREELAASVSTIRESFATVAVEFGLTPENCRTNPAFLQAKYLEADLDNGSRMYGLFRGDAQIGFMELRPKEDGRIELKKLAVRPGHRHCGYGKTLLNEAFALARRRGARVMEIGIIEENAVLKDWYLANGFVHTGVKRYPQLPFTVGFMELAL